MSKSITPIIFGTTDGLEVKYLPYLGDQILRLEDNWVDLKEADINLLDNAPLYYFQRREHLGSVINFIGAYWAVKEIGYARQGSFAGAGFWLEGVTVNYQEIVIEINRLQKLLSSQAILNGQFRKKISETNYQLELNTSSAITGSVATLPRPLISAKKTFIQIGNENIESILNWIQKSEASLNFTEIFIGSQAHFIKLKNVTNNRLPFLGLSNLLDECYSVVQLQTRKNTEIIRKKIEDDFLKKEKENQLIYQQEISNLKSEIQNKENNIKNILNTLSLEDANKWRKKIFPSAEPPSSASLMPKSIKRPLDTYESNIKDKFPVENKNTVNTVVIDEIEDINNRTFIIAMCLMLLIAIGMYFADEISNIVKGSSKKTPDVQTKLPDNKYEQDDSFQNNRQNTDVKLNNDNSEVSKDQNQENVNNSNCFQKDKWISVVYPVDIGTQEGDGIVKEFSNKIKPFCKPLLIDASCSQKLKNINSILAKQNSNYQIELPKSCVEAANNSSGFTAKFIIKEPVNQKADVKVIGNVPSTKK